MTIDLGFAWLTLPNGEAVGVVDVPGHQDFIENMLAGVGGIDAALLVVAADEGVRPQTREHLAILDLLQIPAGLIVLTKADLVDEEWLGLVTAEVRAAVRGTRLEAAPLLPVSARTRQGLPELLAQLQTLLTEHPQRPDIGRPRLPVDRVFSLAGFGTVVTGTLQDGSLNLGEEVEILPGPIIGRVRGLQTHKHKLEIGRPASRLAINLAGVEVGQLRRGVVVTRPGTLTPTTLIDAELRHLAQAKLPLKHNSRIKFFTGAAEVAGVVRLLDRDELAPGATGWVQLALEAQAVVVKGDRFILRRPSPAETIGGGVVTNAHPARRHRRNNADVLAVLETQKAGTTAEQLLEAFDRLGPAPLALVLAETGKEAALVAPAAAELARSGDLLEIDGQALMASRAGWAQFVNQMRRSLEDYHAVHPLRSGMPREELKSRLSQRLEPAGRASWSGRVFNMLVARAAADGVIETQGSWVRQAGYRVALATEEQAQVNALIADFERDPYNTPSVKDCAARLGSELLNHLVEEGRLVQVSAEVLFLAETYAAMLAALRQALAAKPSITVAEVRDLFKTSRKYALALMEHLDQTGLTRRVGDERVLRG